MRMPADNTDPFAIKTICQGLLKKGLIKRGQAKSIITLEGLGKRFSGKYYVVSSTHQIDNGGYSLALEVKTAGSNEPSTAAKADSTEAPQTKSPEDVTPKSKDWKPEEKAQWSEAGFGVET